MTFAATVEALYLCRVVSFIWFNNYLDFFHSTLFLALLNGWAFFMPEKRIFSRFKAFLSLGGIIYHLRKENGLNRRFGKNNSRSKTGQKKCKFFLVENQ